MEVQEMEVKSEPTRPIRYSRSRVRRINSLDLIPEDPVQENIEPTGQHNQLTTHPVQKGTNNKISRSNSLSTTLRYTVLFWPNFFANIILKILQYILYVPLSVAAPSFWLSALLWVFWKCIRIPFGIMKYLFNMDANSMLNQESYQIKKRTILISCGSSIQSLHLARNLYSSGARVIVFEYDGYFGLCRFSTAVDKFYVVPRPTQYNVNSYIEALCHIVQRERPSVYIPVCATSAAYYDSLAKPHLELMGCASFIPGVQETVILDDCLKMYQKCASQNIPLPKHTVVSSLNDLWHLYESDFISNFRNSLVAVGMQGILERYKYILPNNRQEFKFNHDITEQQPWMVIRDIVGEEHFITCSTIKDSRIVANVSCLIENKTKNLIPIVNSKSSKNTLHGDANEIDKWLQNFFNKVRFHKLINGHISFRFVKCSKTGQFLPLNVRIGVSLPYVAYNRSHTQLLYRTMKCMHVNPLNWISSDANSLMTGPFWQWPAFKNAANEIAALDKREALFTYWDPLPYCAYYHFQLPMKSVKNFLQKRNTKNTKNTKNIPLQSSTLPVH